MLKILTAVEKYVLYATVFLLPLTFLPFFPNPYETPKLIILTTGIILALLVKGIRLLLSNENSEITIGNFDIGVILVGASYFLSGILRTPNKMDAFFLPGTATILVAGTLVYFLLNQLNHEEKMTLAFTLFLSGAVLSTFYLLSFSGILLKIRELPNFTKDPLFSPIGGLFALATFLGVILPLGISLILSQKSLVRKLFLGTTTLIILLALVLSVINILPGRQSNLILPNWSASWAVAIEVLKGSPILGMGPGNYLTAFNRFLPLSYNQTPIWAVRFTTGADFFLTALTETGVFALVGLILVLLAIAKRVSSTTKTISETGITTSLCLLVVLLAVFPSTTVLIITFFVFLSLFSSNKNVSLASGTGRILAVVLIVTLATISFQAVKIVDAEFTFGQAISAISTNNGNKTYDLLISSVNKNPQVDRYHAIFAQVNLALARNIAQNATTGSRKSLTDQEKQNVSQLVGQAISEGKAAVNLNLQRSGNWEMLAAIYQTIMPLTQGADQFTIQSMNQAIALDPINPNLRIELGGTYYALGQFDNAIDTFKLATLAKPDLANAHYNLSAAYREKKDFQKAIDEMNVVLSLVKKDSSDYKLAKGELDNLQKSLPSKPAQTGSENLIPPQPAQPPVIKPPLELPKEATPPTGTK